MSLPSSVAEPPQRPEVEGFLAPPIPTPPVAVALAKRLSKERLTAVTGESRGVLSVRIAPLQGTVTARRSTKELVPVG